MPGLRLLDLSLAPGKLKLLAAADAAFQRCMQFAASSSSCASNPNTEQANKSQLLFLALLAVSESQWPDMYRWTTPAHPAVGWTDPAPGLTKASALLKGTITNKSYVELISQRRGAAVATSPCVPD